MKKKIIPDDSRSVIQGAIRPWETKVFGRNRKAFIDTISLIIKNFNINPKIPWKEIPVKVKNYLLYGSEEQINKKNKNDLDSKKIKSFRWNYKFYR